MTPDVSHPGVYVEEIGGPPTIAPADTSTTAFVGVFAAGPLHTATAVTSFAEFAATFGGLSPAGRAGYGIQQFFRNGGTSASVVRVAATDDAGVGGADLAGTPATPSRAATGVHALPPDSFQILCVPDMADTRDGLAGWQAAFSAAVEVCEQQRAFFIVDPPDAWCGAAKPKQIAAMTRFYGEHLRDRTANAAVYFPRLRIADPDGGRETETSGTMAGVYARTDRERGVWKAPAGIEASLRGAAPVVDLTDADIEPLNRMGINALRTFAEHGPVCWGARTLRGADDLGSDWKYVNIRRMVLFLEASLGRGTEWAVFEPNDEPLWAGLRTSVAGFLGGLWADGAFPGATPDDAYFVRCDRTTMTQADIAEGRVNILVGVAPLRPAEFLLIRITHQAQQPSP